MKFKEINGEVFYYIEPTEIDINTKTPLLARYYQGISRMGLLNADLVSEQELNEERIVDEINGKIAKYRNSNKGDNIHRLEMVGKRVPAESPLWWLYQMSLGKKITWPNSTYRYAFMSDEIIYFVEENTKEETVMSIDKWLNVSLGIVGISFYSEPKLKVGDWIKAPLALYEHDLVCRVMSIYNGLTIVKALLTGEEMKFINASPANRIDPEDIVKSLASPEMLKLLMADIDCQLGTNS